MENSDWVIFDGSLIPCGECVIPVQSRGLMYGDGCFDTFRSYKGCVWDLNKHLNRLEEATRFLGMEFPGKLKSGAFKELLHGLLERNKLLKTDAVVRVQVWRVGNRGYSVKPNSETHFSVMATALQTENPPAPATLAIVETRRIPDQALPSRYKLSNGINYIAAAGQARDKGADDALMLTMDGVISETTIANIFWVKDKTIYTPSEKCDLLPGLTRQALIQTIKKSSEFKLEDGAYVPEEIFSADAVWICNSVREVVPVSEIDGQSFPVQHPAFMKIKEGFNAYRDNKLEPLR